MKKLLNKYWLIIFRSVDYGTDYIDVLDTLKYYLCANMKYQFKFNHLGKENSEMMVLIVGDEPISYELLQNNFRWALIRPVDEEEIPDLLMEFMEESEYGEEDE